MENERNPELWGYVREWTAGVPRAEQLAALATMGLTDFDDRRGSIFHDAQAKPKEVGPDRFPNREALLKAAQEGDGIVIAHPCIVGATAGDIDSFMRRVAEKGLRLYDVSEQAWITWTPEALRTATFRQRAIDRNNALKSDHARKARTSKGGRPRVDLTPEIVAKIEAMWRDKDVHEDEVRKLAGRSRTWLNKEFGPRGTGPARRKHKRN